MSALETQNPLFETSGLPFELPPFDELTLEHSREAILAGMAGQREEVAAITGSAEPPTFENTVVALERSGRLLTRGGLVFHNLASSMSTPRLREIERELAPQEAAHSDALRLDPALFARIDDLHRRRHELGLDDEGVRLVERYHLDFVLSGARLDEAGRSRLTELNQELSRLSTTFGQNLQEATEAAAVQVSDPAELDGLDDEEIARPPVLRPTAGSADTCSRSCCRPGSRRWPSCATATCAGGCSRPRSVALPRASTTTGRWPCGWRPCAPSGPGCSASPRTPT